MADFEDAISPHWVNVIDGQVEPERRGARHDSTSRPGREGVPAARPTTAGRRWSSRPRGWHLEEKPPARRRRAGRRVPGRLRAVLLPQRARAARARQRPVLLPAEDGEPSRGPALERRLRARRRRRSGSPHGTIRATVLIETIPAAFEMDEFLYELRDHAAGLNAGRWDYLFSMIKTFRDAGRRTCCPTGRSHDDRAVHARLHRPAGDDLPPPRRARDRRHGGVHPQPPRPGGQRGGAGQGPRGQGARGRDGFDGSWVAHPDLVPVAREVFDAVLGDRPNQKDGSATTSGSPPSDLLDVAETPAADRGRAAEQRRRRLAYLEAWLGGNGAVADPQPHGGCRDGGDLPVAALAVGPQRRHARG